MHPSVIWKSVVVAATLLFAVHPQLEAQRSADWPVLAMRAVMNYRMAVLGDTVAKLDLCRSASVLGDAVEGVRADLVARGAGRILLPSCEASEGGAPPGLRYVMSVDSISQRSDGGARVRVTVIRGEYIHREDFTLLARSHGMSMDVAEVRLSAASQAYPRRPPVPPSPQP